MSGAWGFWWFHLSSKILFSSAPPALLPAAHTSFSLGCLFSLPEVYLIRIPWPWLVQQPRVTTATWASPSQPYMMSSQYAFWGIWPYITLFDFNVFLEPQEETLIVTFYNTFETAHFSCTQNIQFEEKRGTRKRKGAKLWWESFVNQLS